MTEKKTLLWGAEFILLGTNPGRKPFSEDILFPLGLRCVIIFIIKAFCQKKLRFSGTTNIKNNLGTESRCVTDVNKLIVQQ